MGCSRWLPCDFKQPSGRTSLLQTKDFSSYNFLEKSHPWLSSTPTWKLSHVIQQGELAMLGYQANTAIGSDRLMGCLCPKCTCVAGTIMLWMENAVMLSPRSCAALNIHSREHKIQMGPQWLELSGAAEEVQPGHPEQGSFPLCCRGRENKPKQQQQQPLPVLIRVGGGRNNALSRPSAWFVSEF